MRFRVLGPMQVWHGDGWHTIRAAQPRVVLAVLLAQAGQVVSADRLVDELWGDHPPRTALNTIQGYVARLRKLLGDADSRLLTRDRGYLLEVADGALDAHVFERLVESGQRGIAGGELAAGVQELVEALALWRGPALDDVPASPTVTAEVNRLEQRRLTALEARLGAELALGRHLETVDELQRLVEEFPLREQLRCHLMLAMYRCGRRAEALDVYRNGRAVMVAELGMEPGPELRELERAILADDRTLMGGTETTTQVRPAQVPADVAGFTGRQPLLRQLDRLLPSRGPAVAIITVAGTPGVGKTALAVHWAHRVRDRFGDGQLYVNLRGYAAGEPVRPIDALARFLHALGVPAEQVPTDAEEAAALYRSVLADRRMLVLLDNAHHPDQVRPLLPSAPGCLVLVTSRDALTGLVARDGARGLRLDVLTPDEAHDLLTYLLGADRVHTEAAELAELAELCAYLPLALRITAANIGEHSVAEYCELLRAGNRLAALEVEGDEQAAVRAAFDLSYAALPDDARRLFRLLGLVPGPDVTVEAAAALSDVDTGTAGRLLTRLAAAHLAAEQPGARYSCHDLLRLYASERGEQEDSATERDEAVQRLYNWYLHTVDAAATLLYPEMRRLTLPPAGTAEGSEFADSTQALAWLDAERHNLVAAVRHQPLPVVGLLADALRGYFWNRMYTVDWLAVANAGLVAARECGDLTTETGALLSLADANFRQGRYQQAMVFSTRALDTARRAEWADGEAAALNNLGNLHRMSGQLREAVDFHQTALALNRRIGRLANQYKNLSNLGITYRHLGELHTALLRQLEALAISREIGSPQAEMSRLSDIGAVLHDLGRFTEALENLRLALAKQDEVGDRGEEVEIRHTMAEVLRDTGDHTAAMSQAQSALTLARDAEFRRGEIDVLNTLGTIHLRQGHHSAAVDHHRQALALARDTAWRYGETHALIGLAVTRRDEVAARQAIELASEVGFRVLEGQARTVLAAIQLDRDEFGEAAELAAQALAIQRETGHRLGEAEALYVLGGVADRTGDPDRALARWRETDVLLADIGAIGPGTAHSSGRGLGWTSAGSVPNHGPGGE